MTESDKRKLDKERERQRLVNAYHRAFDGDGKTILADLEKAFGTDNPAFLPAFDYNPTVAAIRDGQRSVILHIQHMLSQPVIADDEIEVPKTKVLK